MIWVRSTLFFAGMAISAVLFCPVALLVWPVPVVTRMRIIGLWAHFIRWWLALTCGLRHEVKGLEHLPSKPGVILSKHQSAWETIVFQVIFPPQTWALKREALWLPFFGWGLAATSPIAINRDTPVRALERLLRQGCEKIAQGRWVVIFPEGTRMAPGEQGAYHPGGAMLAVKAGVPVVPIAHDAGLYWGRRSFLKKPGVIRVCVGPPIATDGAKARAVNQAAQEWIESTMASLLGASEQPVGSAKTKTHN
ncbi:MAG: 1-acyl-sn-glycerol-3-phosphate acyltransferase [Acidiferrobacteraceae bacterium]|jgi:1-acyl-sn-glycerol-3-phosphate acyltransferase|nr:1-acyl-sn-glycerol-3-phosphate acyltransferase [Acidiferrobacteraceae bacterium]MCP4830130.1 1-acyl-sn-glycerol-3-phosphate acyltransferase [Pseudomonadota bacterium]MDP6949794.1 lysophospholipid acyltransferase family protein [Arenicellales bacterium]HJP07211.1 lysophospholipid acyltransferase family protein [Arenicellales bacterium]|tara:strand:+ start:12091 stop:12843 length:753 start_codon:yes stop_codon:yes gene_type:complete